MGWLAKHAAHSRDTVGDKQAEVAVQFTGIRGGHVSMHLRQPRQQVAVRSVDDPGFLRYRYFVDRADHGNQIVTDDNRLLRYNINRYRLPIHIIVRNGSVRLEGTVANMMDKRLVEFNVRGITGVVSVANNLKIETE